mmetsp:Transcript_2390/g.2062  ORF Transcript_2390/g.2062 Transcript_2390/m.2062 type:complete len:96 (-) Transcript_2390:15-302(-)
MLKNKTVLLVTHQTQFLRKVDHVVLLDKGNIIAQGSYQELRKDKSLKTHMAEGSPSKPRGGIQEDDEDDIEDKSKSEISMVLLKKYQSQPENNNQ